MNGVVGGGAHSLGFLASPVFMSGWFLAVARCWFSSSSSNHSPRPQTITSPALIPSLPHPTQLRTASSGEVPEEEIGQAPAFDEVANCLGALSEYYLWLAAQSRMLEELPATGPSITVSPVGVIGLGAAITIHCQCRCRGRRLVLYKNTLQIREVDTTEKGGEFTIPSAQREDAGSYSCRSRSRSEPPNWSLPSDNVRIVVAELSYPKPSISLRPSRRVSLGEDVTVQCQGQHQNASFLLYKDEKPAALEDAEPAGHMAEFPIRNVRWRDVGCYHCQYRIKLHPSVWSHLSDPLELALGGEGSGSASLLPCPHPARTSEVLTPVGHSEPGGADPTHPAAAPAPTHLGSVGPAAPLKSPDFTHTNITRLALSALVLLILGLILAEAYYNRPRGAS
ncbi:platelet glycoprotein VI-like [Carettochelys insculpta]|uniref:platelet glycoprotein VI-like n=1 Tax=Carettochelys insculpta TaxID=44489 RepID=UPI003EBF478F